MQIGIAWCCRVGVSSVRGGSRRRIVAQIHVLDDILSNQGASLKGDFQQDN